MLGWLCIPSCKSALDLYRFQTCLHGLLFLHQERCEPGVCKVARYHGPLVLELRPDVPGVPRASAERFKPAPACPAFQAAWDTRSSTGDVDLQAADGSRQRVHKLVLQCRMPVLHGQPVPPQVQQVRHGPCERPNQVVGGQCGGDKGMNDCRRKRCRTPQAGLLRGTSPAISSKCSTSCAVLQPQGLPTLTPLLALVFLYRPRGVLRVPVHIVASSSIT